MDEERELTTFVIRELGKHRRRSDIVMDVCERTGMEWPAAQRLVYQIAFDHRKKVAARQSPLAIIFGVGFVVGGFALALFSAILILLEINLHYEGISYAGNIAGIGFGVILMAGGIIGLWDTIQQLM